MSVHDDLAADVARRFHEAYERLAPTFGYETRPESAVPWEDVPEANRALMTAVVSEVEADLVARLREAEARVQELERERDEALDREAGTSDAMDGMRERALAAEAALAESAKREGEWRRKFGRAAHELNEAEAALADMRRALTVLVRIGFLVSVDGERANADDVREPQLRKLLFTILQAEDTETATRALAAADSGQERETRALDLLRRIRQWDALNPAPDPVPAPFGDLPYWIAEIDRALAAADTKEET